MCLNWFVNMLNINDESELEAVVWKILQINEYVIEIRNVIGIGIS